MREVVLAARSQAGNRARFRSGEVGGRGRAGFGVRLGPAAEPQAFARRVGFGRVASVQGRRITVVGARADPADLAEARAGRSAPDPDPERSILT